MHATPAADAPPISLPTDKEVALPGDPDASGRQRQR